MKKNQDKWNDKQNISQKYEKYGNIKTTYQTVTFCKLGKCIMYHNVGRNYQSGKRFVRPWRFVCVYTNSRNDVPRVAQR